MGDRSKKNILDEHLAILEPQMDRFLRFWKS